jgi:hypothetical protein
VLVSAQGGDEPRHADVAAQLAEGLGRLDEGDGDPAQDHRAAIPLGHVVGLLADAAVDELDGVGRRQRSFQPARQTEVKDSEGLIEALEQRGGGRCRRGGVGGCTLTTGGVGGCT